MGPSFDHTLQCTYSDVVLLFGNSDLFNDQLSFILNNDAFWNVFSITRSSPDGHCFLYSIISALNSDGWSITKDDLCQSIEFEIFDNTNVYLPFMGEDSSLLLFQSLYAYTVDKHYDTEFGDLIPQICANALNVNINIVSRHVDRNIFYRIQPHASVASTDVFVYKSGPHYDALLPVVVCNESSAVNDGPCKYDRCTDGGPRNDIQVSASPTRAESLKGPKNRKSSHIPTQSLSTDSFQVYSFEDGLGSSPISFDRFGICFHNIHGLTLEKLSDDILGSFFKKFRLILLCETWLDKSQTDEFDVLDNYSFYNFSRAHRHPRAIRDSGGLGIYVHKSVGHGVDFTSTVDDIITTMRLKKDVFGLPMDIYVSNCYIVPSNSTHLIADPFSCVQQEIAKIPGDQGCLTFLDSNAHTNISEDYSIECEGSGGDLDNLLPSSENSENIILELYHKGVLKRTSSDSRPLNSHGRDFLDMCKSSNMLILNSRIAGNDYGKGKSTHFNPDGTSGVLDYAICSPNLFEFISRFDIHAKVPESDHCPISIEFPINMQSTQSSISTSVADKSVEWGKTEHFLWRNDDLFELQQDLDKKTESLEYSNFIDAISCNEDPDKVANLFNSFFIKSCKRVFKSKRSRKIRKKTYRRIKFFDQECRQKRIDAIQAGARVASDQDRSTLNNKTKSYKSCIQRKKRKAKSLHSQKLIKLFEKDASSIWAELNSSEDRQIDAECRETFLNHFKKLGIDAEGSGFDEKHLEDIESFLKTYKTDELDDIIDKDVFSSALNENFTLEEVEYAIGCLKNKKSPGIDSIPAEFIKFCKNSILSDLHNMFNFMLEKRQFPTAWAEGLKSAVHKAGLRNNPNNYRGITVLGIFAKLFETLVSNRFQFLNEAFGKIDQNNGGFLKGKRTTDNIFILISMIQRQLMLGKSLYVCFVDFSKAFDLVNRAILFHKLIHSGWSGRLLETVKDMYGKTSFRFKFQGETSSPIPNNLGVNQGGNASGFLFRKYISDLGEYLSKKVGVCIGETIISHLLWADDLILFSDSLSGIQRQLDGLYDFCSKNRMIVNELKTKLMVFGNGKRDNIKFNGKSLEWVDQYKYLGNLINSTKSLSSDIFRKNASFLCDKARKAIFAFFRKTKSYGTLPPNILVQAYTVLIQPILLYGSDVWGYSKSMCDSIDRVCLFFIRCILRVKTSTSRLMCYGELGITPPSLLARANFLSFHLRLRQTSASNLEKISLLDLMEFRDAGFENIISKVYNIAADYNVNLECGSSFNSKALKGLIKLDYIESWKNNVLCNNSSLRLYKLFKNDFVLEPYLECVTNDKHRFCLTKFRCSSHFLEIERARHQQNIKPIWERVCHHCKFAVDDELHLLLFCKVNIEARNKFMTSIASLIPNLAAMHHQEKFIQIMSSKNKYVLQNLAKFIYESFKVRNEKCIPA